MEHSHGSGWVWLSGGRWESVTRRTTVLMLSPWTRMLKATTQQVIARIAPLANRML